MCHLFLKTIQALVVLALLSACSAHNGTKAVNNASSGTGSNSEPGLAFPGAQGFGRFASGGRAGDVYHVTHLEDSGPGSLRAGISTASGPRTIVFDVSGTIHLQSSLHINKGNLTIAGQTAPKGGITVAGYNTLIEANNVIVRFMRFRCGDFNVYDTTGVKPPRGNGDLKGGNADAISVIRSKNVILDHLSASWSVDESLSVTWSNDVTVQNSIISEPLNDSYLVKKKRGRSYLQPHAFGSLVRANNNHDGGYTYYRNLYAHCDMRNPGVGPNQGEPTVYEVKLDFVNNVVYGWGRRQGESIDGSKGGKANINMVNNYYIANGDSDDPGAIWDDQKFESIYTYQSGNKVDSNKNNSLDGSTVGWEAFQNFLPEQKISSRWDYPKVATDNADVAFNWVKQHVGASLSRDTVDARIIDQMLSNTGKIIDSQEEVGGLPSISSNSGALDSDMDGIPDHWEETEGLDKNDSEDGRAYSSNKHYTNLEMYLNSLVVY